MLSKKEKEYIYEEVQKFAFNKSKLDDSNKIFVQMLLSKDCATSVVKEKATLLEIGYNTTAHMHGFDGVREEDNRQVEVKSETSNPDSGKYGKKLNGGAGWGTKTMATYNKLLEENPLLVHSGFTPDGKCVYVAEVEFNKTKIWEQVKKYAESRKKGSNSTTKSNFRDWEMAPLTVHYFNPKYADEHMTKDFADLITSKWRETQKDKLMQESKEDLVELILNGG